MRGLKILRIVPSYFPAKGGIQTFTYNIDRLLVSYGHEVDVWTTKSLSDHLPDRDLLAGVKVKRYNRQGYLKYSPKLSTSIKELKNEFDILHFHNYHTFTALGVISVPAGHKVVFTPHYHGRASNLFNQVLLSPYSKFLGKKIYKRSDFIICRSEFEKELVIKHFGVNNQKISVVRGGINIEEIKNATSYNHDKKVILSVCRLDKHKNIHKMIGAMQYVPLDYEFIIIGEGPFKKHLVNMISNLNLGKRIKILSGLSNEEVFKWYQTSSVVVNFSSLEAFGLNVVEGLAAEKKVIVNDSSALAELARRHKNVHSLKISETKPCGIAKQVSNIMGHQFYIENDLDVYDFKSSAVSIMDTYNRVLKGLI